ncbi:phosphotransferase [Pseudotabrizicola sp. L79]|uniref:phosphotransferase n=1 Tax=Pseudotabrizicola sp. L79 TaxID=3118402 RepID=UPI002F95796F
MQDDVAKLLAGVPGITPGGTAQRLGGLTNRVYRLRDFIIRVPGEGTETYINRQHEAIAARAAAAAGVSPEVIHFDETTGVMITRFIDSTTMTPQGFKTRTGSSARAARALRQLHQSGQTFPARFELFAMIDDYLGHLSGKDVPVPPGYPAVLAEAEAVRTALARSPVPLAPCHCDPLCENFLDTGSRMWIVDWEYSGMNDPMWDLGDLSVEGQFDAAQDAEMLAAYFDGPPTPQDHARMVIYKAMCDLLWTLWGLLQLANDNPAEDFRAYADTRFARCRALMATPEFADHLALLQRP